VNLGEFEELYPEPTSQIPDSSVYVQFAGISTLLVSDGETKFMTDGFFSRPSIFKILFGKVEPDTADIHWALDR